MNVVVVVVVVVVSGVGAERQQQGRDIDISAIRQFDVIDLFVIHSSTMRPWMYCGDESHQLCSISFWELLLASSSTQFSSSNGACSFLATISDWSYDMV